MPDIKTREIAKGTVKAIDKSAVAAERMKSAYIRIKDKADHSLYSAEGSPDEYAADRVSGGTRNPPPVKPSASLINSGARA